MTFWCRAFILSACASMAARSRFLSFLCSMRDGRCHCVLDSPDIALRVFLHHRGRVAVRTTQKPS